MSDHELTPGAIVAAAYEELLLRPADPEGLESKAHRLASGEMTISGLFAEILGSEEFAAKSALFLRRHIVRERQKLTNDVSQYGEFFIFLQQMVNARSTTKYVVDVGARGRERSNSYDLLHHFGWRGLLIEANPQLETSIREEFAGTAFELVSCAVSNYTGVAQLTIGANDDVSSLTEKFASGWGPTRGQIEVPVRPLPDILDEHGAPKVFGLLSLDIEGEDIIVLNNLVETSDYRPTWILLEASYNFATKSLRELPLSDLVRDTYDLVGQTPANLLLANKQAGATGDCG
jgi:FkbM family methyltransferase